MDSEQPGETQRMCRRRPEKAWGERERKCAGFWGPNRPPGPACDRNGGSLAGRPRCATMDLREIPHTTRYSILVNCESPVIRRHFARKIKGKRLFPGPDSHDLAGPVPCLSSRVSHRRSRGDMASWGCHQGVTRGLGVLVFLLHAPAGGQMIDLGMALKVALLAALLADLKFFSQNRKKMLAKGGRCVYNPSSLERSASAKTK